MYRILTYGKAKKKYIAEKLDLNWFLLLTLMLDFCC